MYQKKAFNRREQDYAMALRRKLEEAETMIQHLAPSRARSLALTKLDEALLWTNVGIAEAGLQQGYTAAPRNRGFDFDDALATNVDGQQVRATRAGDITLDGMKIVPRRDENHAVTAQNAAPSAEGDLVLLKPGQVAIDAGRLAKLVEESAQKEAAMGEGRRAPPSGRTGTSGEGSEGLVLCHDELHYGWLQRCRGGIKMEQRDFMTRAKQLVVDYFNSHVDATDGKKLTMEDVFIVWFSKTLQNWKALVSTTVSDGMYYEITHNGDKKETYLDVYKKWENQCIADGNTAH